MSLDRYMAEGVCPDCGNRSHLENRRITKPTCERCGMPLKHWSPQRAIDCLLQHAEGGKPPTADEWRFTNGGANPARGTVLSMFGSWSNYFRAAGLKPRRACRQYTWTKQMTAAAMLDFLFANGRWPTSPEWRFAHPTHPCSSAVIKHFGSWQAAKRYAGWRSPEELAAERARRRQYLDTKNAQRRADRRKGGPVLSSSPSRATPTLERRAA